MQAEFQDGGMTMSVSNENEHNKLRLYLLIFLAWTLIMMIIQQMHKTTSTIPSKCDVIKGKSGRGLFIRLLLSMEMFVVI